MTEGSMIFSRSRTRSRKRSLVAIEPQLLAAEARRLAQRSTSDLRAWECAMRSLPHIWRFTLEEPRSLKSGSGGPLSAIRLTPMPTL